MIDFVGSLRDDAGPDHMVAVVVGQYRWLDERLPIARVAGEIIVERTLGDLFDVFGGVRSFRGRTSRLEIPGVGLSPVRIYSDGKIRDDRTTLVTFEAWLPPVPIATKPELADALRTPIADALEEAGQSGLADLARSAAVALVGFPRPHRPGKG